jgi:hypothetical protein
MGLISIFEKKKDIKGEELPWHNLPSIFEYIKSNLDIEGKLTEAGNKLPDEERRYKEEKLRWVPGAMDGVFGHHSGGSNLKKVAKNVADLIQIIE